MDLPIALVLAWATHEIGHVLASRFVGVRVVASYLFFDANGFALMRWRVGGMCLGLGWIPLGGRTELLGQREPSETSGSITRASRAQQAFIILGGCLVNAVGASCMLSDNQTLQLIGMVSGANALLQMVPMPGHDGWHLLRLLKARGKP